MRARCRNQRRGCPPRRRGGVLDHPARRRDALAAMAPPAGPSAPLFVFLGVGPRRYFDKRPAWWTWDAQADATLGEVVSVGDMDRDGCADILVQIPMWRHGSA